MTTSPAPPTLHSDRVRVIPCPPFCSGEMGPPGEVTHLLRAWNSGDRGVEERLFRLVLPELRKLARRFIATERPEHTLQASALLNEAYLRLLEARERDWQSRRHFFAIAARVMRRFLVDYGRARTLVDKALIDGNVELLRDGGASFEQAFVIDHLLHDLEGVHPDLCSIVELKYFMGLTDEETADALGLPLRTMQRRFGDARRWLFERLQP